MRLEGKKVLVIGTGISGIGAVELLEEIKAYPVIYDSNDQTKVQEVKEKLGEESHAEVIIGNWDINRTKEFDLVVLSPGVPTDIPMLEDFREQGIPIWGEIELAYENSKGKILAITGTNGKTTTTTLLGQIMKHHQNDVFVVGNIGEPYTKAALKTTSNSIIVAEISSFQLETIHSFHPRVSAILNITPDHLDRHKTLEEYMRVKEMITKNQTKDDVCVLNYEDPNLRKFGAELETQVLFFSSQRRLEKGIYLFQDKIWLAEDEKQEILLEIRDLKVLGAHNYENIMAAIAMAYCAGVPMAKICEVVTSFKGVEHRIEFVVEKKGVAYYNDSKGTNPDAAIKGIEAMERPTYLIGGGYDKGADYTKWVEAFHGKVKALVLIGATREKIQEAAHNCGFKNTILADTLEEAVSICAGLAKAGEAVLLSPACASWGMFKNYEVRGDAFKQYVEEL